jgi:serine/threonine protein kinase
VFKGEYNNKAVAIKTVSPKNSGGGNVTNLLEEVSILCHLGMNKYIVGLVGASTLGIKNGKVFAVFELCRLGSLLGYLRRSRFCDRNLVQNDRISIETTSNLNVQDSDMNDTGFSSWNLVSWSLQISKGMEYLTEKQVSSTFCKTYWCIIQCLIVVRLYMET